MIYRFFTIIIAFWSIAATAETDPVQAPVPGQIISYQFGSGGMLATAGVDWDSYTKVQLERATVEFRENWISDQRKINVSFVRESDAELIKTEMSDLLDKVLTQKLSDKDGYTLTAESGADVLRFTPRIAKLDIYAPGQAQDFVGHVLIDSKGSMVLAMDISDSVSGELLASAWQLQVDSEKGYTDSATSARNRTAFGQMMRRWATWLVELLDVVREEVPE